MRNKVTLCRIATLKYFGSLSLKNKLHDLIHNVIKDLGVIYLPGIL